MEFSSYSEEVRKKISLLEEYSEAAYDGALRLSGELLKIAKRREDPVLKGFCFLSIGRYYYKNKSLKMAEHYLLGAASEFDSYLKSNLEMNKEIKEELSRVYFLLGMVRKRQGSPLNSGRLFFLSAKEANAALKIRNYLELSEIFYFLENKLDAKRYIYEAEKLLEENNQNENYAKFRLRAFFLRIRILSEDGALREAGMYIREMDLFAQKNGKISPEPYVSLSHIVYGKYSLEKRWEDFYIERLRRFFKTSEMAGEYGDECLYLLWLLKDDAFYQDDFRVLSVKLENYLEETGLYDMKIRLSLIKSGFYENLKMDGNLFRELKIFKATLTDAIRNFDKSLLESGFPLKGEDGFDFRKISGDDLTGLPGKNEFGEYADRIFLRQRSRGKDFGILIISIDGMKRINDLSGYTTGDECIRAVADAIREGAQKGSPAGRYEGDEFICVFSDIDPSSIMQRVRECLNDIIIKRKIPSLTLSEGSFHKVPEAGEKIWTFYYKAYTSLLEAKKRR